jgi:hypothetical protein
MADARRVINKPGQKPSVPGSENIIIKPKGVEERLKDVEGYLQQADPILRTAVKEIADIKNLISTLNEDITKVAGIQARSNNYIEGKLAEINATFGAIVSVVKKIDDDYQALFADEGGEQEPQGYPGPEEELEQPPGEYTDDDLFEDETAAEEPPIEEPKPIEKPKVEKPVPKQPDKKKK